MQTIFGIVGPLGAGKGTLAKYLQENYGATILSAPDLLKEILAQIRVPATREHLQDLAEFVCTTYGMQVLYEELLRRHVTPETRLVVVDGIRYPAQVDYLRSLPDTNFFLAAVHAPFEVRYERVRKRDQYEGEAGFSSDQFRMVESHPVESQVPFLMRCADFKFDSTFPKAELVEQVRVVMTTIL